MNDTQANDAARLAAKKLPELQAIATSLGIKGVRKLRKGDLIAAIAGTGQGASSARRAQSETSEQPVRAEAPSTEAPKAEAAPRIDTIELPEAKPAAADAGESSATPSAQSEGGRRVRRGGRRTHSDESRRDGENLSRAEAQPADGEKREGETRERRERPRSVDDIQLPDYSQRTENSDNRRRNRNDRPERRGADQERGERTRDGEDDDRRGRSRNRRERDRDRNKRRRDGEAEVQVREDDVLVSVAGVLDIRDNYAFVRTTGYLPGPSDVYVSMNQVKKYGLRKGDAIAGQVKAPKDGEDQQQVQDYSTSSRSRHRNNRPSKFAALVSVDAVNGLPPERAKQRVEFGKLTPLYPDTRLRLENKATNFTPRIIDLVAPIGKGQRGLIVAPPKAGKTIILQQIADAITQNNPEVHLMVVLVDERPEEVTDMQRTVKGEVIASTFDRPADDHTTVAELAIERAKRLVEMGRDVVVLLDSITRLGRAYNLAAPASGRILSGGVDSSALYPPKRFFGAARNVENGGSLTILATALVDTGSKMDEVIFEEFKGTGNWELKLDRKLSERRIFPAVDVNASGTRREEELMTGDELAIMWKLRRVLSQLEQQQAIELLLERLKKTQNNGEFLLTVSKSTPATPTRTSE